MYRWEVGAGGSGIWTRDGQDPDGGRGGWMQGASADCGCGDRAWIDRASLGQQRQVTQQWWGVVEVLLYVHRNSRLITNIRDGSPGRPPRLSHISWALMVKWPMCTDEVLLRDSSPTGTAPNPPPPPPPFKINMAECTVCHAVHYTCYTLLVL